MTLPSSFDLLVSWYNKFTLRIAHISLKKKKIPMGARSDDRHPLLAICDYHRSVVERLCEGLKHMERGVVISPHYVYALRSR